MSKVVTGGKRGGGGLLGVHRAEQRSEIGQEWVEGFTSHGNFRKSRGVRQMCQEQARRRAGEKRSERTRTSRTFISAPRTKASARPQPSRFSSVTDASLAFNACTGMPLNVSTVLLSYTPQEQGIRQIYQTDKTTPLQTPR